MGVKVDLTGRRYGRLTVTGEAPRSKGAIRWHCVCDCGHDITTTTGKLNSNWTKSCGCLKRELESEFGKRMLHHHNTHGLSRTPTYKSWDAMIQRCTNPNHEAYERYAGRGIKICERWLNFANFVEDLGIRPAGTTLERIDNNDGYNPENCVWASWAVQGRNRRNVKLTEFAVKHIKQLYTAGFKQKEIAERYGVTQNTISRIVNHKRWTDQLDIQ